MMGRTDLHPTRRAALRMGVAAALATSAGHASQAFAQAKPSLTIAAGADVLTTNPFKISVGGDYVFFANVFEGLYGHDTDGRLAPTLAESVKISDDGLVYDFTLKPAKFHNGDAVTAEDVRFSWQFGVDPKTGNARGAVLLTNIADIEVQSERQLRIHLKQRDAAMLENMELFFMIVPKRYFESVGPDGFAEKPVGTCPFAFVEQRIREYIKLRGFEGHWGRVPQVGDLTIKIVPQDQARIAQVQTGEADIVTAVPPALAPHLGATAVQAITADLKCEHLFRHKHHRQSARPEERRGAARSQHGDRQNRPGQDGDVRIRDRAGTRLQHLGRRLRPRAAQPIQIRSGGGA